MQVPREPLIVGAGPVGLGAALFLAREGQAARIVEMRTEPSPHSKALAVNPRTLEILGPTGVARQMLLRGKPIHGAWFHRGGRIIGQLEFDGIHPRYPFMLALSQATSERLLAEALAAVGGRVERGIKLLECRNAAESVEAVLMPTAGGPRETVPCPWLLAADGARSIVRQQIGVDFVGSSFAAEWHLADVPLETALADDQAHVFFLDDGAFLFLIRVVDDVRAERSGPRLWRVIANRPEPMALLVDARQAGEPVWTSAFHIAHRVDAHLSVERVYFAGDAAHVHSPVGARGMNLGLEDAWVFARLAVRGRLAEYDDLRRPVDQCVVRQVKLLSEVASAETPLDRLLRVWGFPLALRLAPLRHRMATTITGLDHGLPDL